MVASCAVCGTELRPAARFCADCGAAVDTVPVRPPPGPPRQPDVAESPPPQSRTRGRYTLPLAVAAVVVLGLGVGAATLLLRPTPGVPAASAPSTGQAATSTSAPSPLTTSPPTAVPAAVALARQATADRPAVEAVVGYWVPQISSKAPGLVVAGTTYDERRILDEFRSAAAIYPDVALLRSEDYRSFKRPGFWVTIVARPFAGAGDANAWCGQQGFAIDDCFAKRLSHIEGPEGNTAPR
jgi:hypothetical protein